MVESLVTSLKDVHLWEEKLRVPFKVKFSIEFSKGGPKSWPPFLTELTVENYNCPLSHQMPYIGHVFDEPTF